MYLFVWKGKATGVRETEEQISILGCQWLAGVTCLGLGPLPSQDVGRGFVQGAGS